MMKRLMVVLPLVCGAALANDFTGTIDTQWNLSRHWENDTAPLDWQPSTQWHAQIDSLIAVQKNGFELAVRFSDTEADIEQLYIDIPTDNADWTIGRKPQDWAYAHSSDALNWIDEQSLILREQYFPFASLQTFCAFAEASSDADCGARFSGWLGRWDWQIASAYNNRWKTAAALQTQLFSGGLFYLESLYQTDQSRLSLSHLTESVFVTETTSVDNLLANAGLQWTFPTDTTLHYELSFDDNALTKKDWQRIESQLQTPQAGLLSEAIASPFGEQQHLLRLEQGWQTLSLELALVYWPDAFNSWLLQTTAGYEFDTRLTLKTEWTHHAEDSVLGLTGLGDRKSVV